MSLGEFQYIADSELIEKIAKLSALNDVLYKEAGIVDDIFSGVGPAAVSYTHLTLPTM
jgi:hypothetical protein